MKNEWSIAWILVGTLLVAGCTETVPRRNPVGERFPTLTAKALDESAVSVPDDFAGQPTLLLIGYEMDSQFDIDRWLLGIQQIELDLPIYELPTIPGLVPGLFGNVINDGMRSGIPKEDWAIVVTLYDDADKVVAFLGNETPLPARVVLLDGQGTVAFFHDRGYSTTTLIRLRDAVTSLRAEPE